MAKVSNVKIGNCYIGPDDPVYIVAELSANHHHNLDIAQKTIEAIKESGADAVKFQTYTADTLTIDCNNEYFQIKQGTLWDGKTLYDLYKEAYMPWEWQPKLKRIAEELGLICFSSAFDKTSVDFLEEMDVAAHKIASFEITDIPLIEYVASKGKPILISTGIATIEDIEDAVDACRNAGNDQVVILKCTSCYPAKEDQLNLKTITDIAQRFGVNTGFSDHSISTTVPAIAVACGACIIEKHFILDKSQGGPDAVFSLEPAEFKQMVDTVKNIEKASRKIPPELAKQAKVAIGKVSYELSEQANKNRNFCRSLFVVEDIKAGDAITEENVRSIRPGFGLSPEYLKDVLGRVAAKDIKRGTPLSWDLF